MFDSSFEIKFSQLADARLQEMVPSLNEYKVGFQLIDKNEESTKGAGVMAFLINNTWVYIPAFFLSGKLKLPCIYIKNYDMRCPLNDSWVSYIKSNELESLGSLIPSDAVESNNAKADLLNIIGKQGSEKNDFLSPEEIKHMYASRKCNNTNLMEDLKKLDKEDFIKMAKQMNEDDDFANAILKYYEPYELRKVAAYLDNKPEPAQEELPVKTLTKESMEAKDLTEEEIGKMMREGCYIKDDRIDTSIVYKRTNAIETGFHTPNEPGFYEVLMSDGSTKDCIICFPHDFKNESYPSHHGRRQLGARCAIIFKDNPSKYIKCSANKVLVRNCKCIEDSGIKGNSANIKDDLNRTKLSEMKADTIMIIDRCGNSYTLNKQTPWPKIRFTDRPGKLHVRYGTLMIPNGVMVFKQIDNFDETSDKHIALGDVNTYVNECIRRAEMSPLKIYHDSGTGYFVTSNKVDKPALKKQAALELLVYNHGIRASKAEDMLKEAADHGSAPKTTRYIIKYAGIYDMSTDMGTIGREVKQNTESNVTVSPDEMKNVATKASETGLKEILDTSVIASLIGTSRTMGKVGDFLPNLIKAMDNLGSILCLYYWDNEEFEEQYGKVEMVELEEKLVDVFNSVGDITLFLKEKTSDAESVFDGNKGNISEDMGDE